MKSQSAEPPALIRFDMKDTCKVPALQRFLNCHGDRFCTLELKVDGHAGPRTADAFRKVFGVRMQGDTRA